MATNIPTTGFDPIGRNTRGALKSAAERKLEERRKNREKMLFALGKYRQPNDLVVNQSLNKVKIEETKEKLQNDSLLTANGFGERAGQEPSSPLEKESDQDDVTENEILPEFASLVAKLTKENAKLRKANQALKEKQDKPLNELKKEDIEIIELDDDTDDKSFVEVTPDVANNQALEQETCGTNSCENDNQEEVASDNEIDGLAGLVTIMEEISHEVTELRKENLLLKKRQDEQEQLSMIHQDLLEKMKIEIRRLYNASMPESISVNQPISVSCDVDTNDMSVTNTDISEEERCGTAEQIVEASVNSHVLCEETSKLMQETCDETPSVLNINCSHKNDFEEIPKSSTNDIQEMEIGPVSILKPLPDVELINEVTLPVFEPQMGTNQMEYNSNAMAFPKTFKDSQCTETAALLPSSLEDTNDVSSVIKESNNRENARRTPTPQVSNASISTCNTQTVDILSQQAKRSKNLLCSISARNVQQKTETKDANLPKPQNSKKYRYCRIQQRTSRSQITSEAMLMDEQLKKCNRLFTKKATEQATSVTKSMESACKSSKPMKCRICRKSCTNLAHLKRHRKVHNLKSLNKCKICSKQVTNLNRHIQTHQDKNFKKYSCVFCNASFLRLKDELHRHIRSHTGEKPFNCDLCDATFTNIAHLRVHESGKHSDKMNIQCEMCGQRFKTECGLRQHTAKVH